MGIPREGLEPFEVTANKVQSMHLMWKVEGILLQRLGKVLSKGKVEDFTCSNV